MKKVKISEYMLRRAIIKSKGFKAFVAQFKERMGSFGRGYYNAVRVDFSLYLKIEFVYHHKDYGEDDIMLKIEKYSTEILKRGFNFDFTIITSFDFKENPNNTFATLIGRQILDVFKPEDMSWYHVIDKINISSSEHYINNLMAWNEGSVGIYHIEQECGEGWITLPKEPENEIRNFIDISY